MPPNAIMDAVARAVAFLRAHPEVFELHRYTQEDPATAEDIARAEALAGYALPEVVRSFYRDCARSIELEWSLRPGRFRDLGYSRGTGCDLREENDDPEAYGYAPRGILHIAPPEQLGRPRIPGVLQLTASDGAGDGYGLERSPDSGALVVVWIAHEERGKRRVKFTTVEDCFADEAATLFATDGDKEGIEAFVQQKSG